MAILFGFRVPAVAAQVFVNDDQLNVSTANENGTTLVPLRAIFQSLGTGVDWDGTTRTVTATKANTKVQLQIGANTAYKNGQAVSLRVPGKILNGSTMVPLRFVSEALGASVNWDGTTQTITITSGSGESTTPSPAPPDAITEVHFIDFGQADLFLRLMPNPRARSTRRITTGHTPSAM